MSNCWEGGWASQPEAEREAAWEMPEDDGWRGDAHLDEWPEHLAGPEYRLHLKWGDQPDAT